MSNLAETYLEIDREQQVRNQAIAMRVRLLTHDEVNTSNIGQILQATHLISASEVRLGRLHQMARQLEGVE